MNIGNIVNWVTAHQAQLTVAATTAVLAYHTIAKGIKDAQDANAGKTGWDKTISVALDTLKYIFGGVRP